MWLSSRSWSRLIAGHSFGSIRPSRKSSANKQTEPEPRTNLRVDTSLVQVRDRDRQAGRPVVGPRKRDFACSIQTSRPSSASPVTTQTSRGGFVFDSAGASARCCGNTARGAQFFKSPEPEG